MKTEYDIIIRPVLTEKSYATIGDKKYVFVVDKTSNKTQIKNAVEKIFGVQVESPCAPRARSSARAARRAGPPRSRRPMSPSRKIPSLSSSSKAWRSNGEVNHGNQSL